MKKYDNQTNSTTNFSDCDFQCNDGSCQPNKNRCDGKNDCNDGIDESNCSTCMITQFGCKTTGAFNVQKTRATVYTVNINM